jgi:hypothetical protein
LSLIYYYSIQSFSSTHEQQKNADRKQAAAIKNRISATNIIAASGIFCWFKIVVCWRHRRRRRSSTVVTVVTVPPLSCSLPVSSASGDNAGNCLNDYFTQGGESNKDATTYYKHKLPHYFPKEQQKNRLQQM